MGRQRKTYWLVDELVVWMSASGKPFHRGWQNNEGVLLALFLAKDPSFLIQKRNLFERVYSFATKIKLKILAVSWNCFNFEFALGWIVKFQMFFFSLWLNESFYRRLCSNKLHQILQ